MDVRGTVVGVTGGASGIGEALCRRFAELGASGVAVLDLDGAGARRVADQLGDPHLALDVDVADETSLVSAIDRIEGDLGPIDLFCSNAGIFTLGGVEVLDDDWDRIWRVNVLAHVFAARTLVPRMIERGGGYLLNTASAAGLLTQLGSAPYAVTKHAALSFAEWLAVTHGHQGLKVSALCPQAVRTNMTAGVDDEDNVAAVDGMIEPSAVADAVVEALAAERFLVLPHPEVEEYFRRKGDDYDRWLRGMQRLQERFAGLMPDP